MNSHNDAAGGIAVIGISGRFPGAKNVSKFWENLVAGVESISRPSDYELQKLGVDAALLKNSNHIKASGTLEDIEFFDASFFGFTPLEAAITDPQHRFLLEAGQEALEDAGYDPERFDGRIGVYVGVGMNCYLVTHLLTQPELVQSVGFDRIMMANDKGFACTKLSYKLNLQGPSISIDTACSSSLVAIHQAYKSLLTFECDMALAGGVRIIVPHHDGELYEEGGILARDGYCRAFDADAAGTVVGSGVGLVVLKRLEDALSDGDTIYAVIKGSAINNDGSAKVSYTAPSVRGQTQVIAEAYTFAGFNADSIGYIEAHGTGTALGDPIEVAGLNEVFQNSTDRRGFCGIGSVKTNIGHLDVAAGVAGFIKVVLALKHKQIPPSLHYNRPNPVINFHNSPFYVNTSLRDWDSKYRPRRAGVSSFGIGGTNAHIVLEEAPSQDTSGPSRSSHLLILSAKTNSALDAVSASLVEYFQRNPEANLADVAYTLKVGRRVFSHRRMVVCQNVDGAICGLERKERSGFSDGGQEERELVFAFMFPGQGSQYVNMLLGVYREEPVFRQEFDRCLEILNPSLGKKLREAIYPHDHAPQDCAGLIDETWLAQPALFIVEYALACLWMSWGINPHRMIGHSVGEYVAACLAGVFSLRDALEIVSVRGLLMNSLPPGMMLAVNLSESSLRPMLDNGCSLAAINSSSRCVVSGKNAAIESLELKLSERGINAHRLRTSHAFHSSMMEPILKAFEEKVRRVQLQAPKIPFVSNVTANWITEQEATDPHYWIRHLRETVRFSDGVKSLLNKPNVIGLEVGPGQTLSTLARQNVSTKNTIIACSRRNKHEGSDTKQLVTALGQLVLAGVEVDWFRYYAQERRHRVPLPTYPFEHRRYWIERKVPVAGTASAQLSTGHEDEPSPVTDLLASGSISSQKRTGLRSNYVAPLSELEKAIISIWQELFGIEGIGIDDNFFELGGDSLLATQLASRLRDGWGVRFSISDLLNAPTVTQLADRIETIRWMANYDSTQSNGTSEQECEIGSL